MKTSILIILIKINKILEINPKIFFYLLILKSHNFFEENSIKFYK
jgi:hypothetical protein